MHRVVVIDDYEPSLQMYSTVIERMLGGQVVPFSDPREALNYVATITPTLIILDQNMPEMDGLQVVHELRNGKRSRGVPIIMLTGINDPVLQVRAMDAGVNTFLVKPIGAEEFASHIKRLSAASRVRFDDEEDVTETFSVRETSVEPPQKPQTERERDMAMLWALFRAYEARDPEAAKRMRLASEIALLLAIEARCAPYDVQLIREAGFVYDIGKLAISEKIFASPTTLSPAARKHVHTHCEIGAQILSVPGSRLFEAAAQMAREHHERYDGDGYPNRLKGTEISMSARVIAVADAFIAMMHKRADRPAMTFGHARDQIKRESGTHFDPTIATALETIQNKIAERLRELTRA